MQQTCKMSDVFLQVLFHSSVYLIFRLLLKNRIMIILMANSNHTCLLVSRRTPVSGINCVFSFVIFNSITSPRAASIRCFMTAVFPFDVACTGFEYLSFSSFLEIETYLSSAGNYQRQPDGTVGVRDKPGFCFGSHCFLYGIIFTD